MAENEVACCTQDECQLTVLSHRQHTSFHSHTHSLIRVLTPSLTHSFTYRSLTLLDVRRAGAPLARLPTDAPLRCCLSDGGLAVAGSEAGAVQLWDVGLMTGSSTPAVQAVTAAVQAMVPAPDGLYPSWRWGGGTGASGMGGGSTEGVPITAVAVQGYVMGGGVGSVGSQAGVVVDVAAALEDGRLAVVLGV